VESGEVRMVQRSSEGTVASPVRGLGAAVGMTVRVGVAGALPERRVACVRRAGLLLFCPRFR
jgi:hypothetical protein